jgi:hypothetical protein
MEQVDNMAWYNMEGASSSVEIVAVEVRRGWVVIVLRV